jgi:hypothetical protein
LLVEAPSDKRKSMQRFHQKAVVDLGMSGLGGADPSEVFKGFMLRDHPFHRFGCRPRKAT